MNERGSPGGSPSRGTRPSAEVKMTQKNNDKLPERKHPAHGVAFIEGQPTIVFDTVNTKDRAPWLACDEVHDLLCEIWREATAWLMGRYVIMPDHIHYFAAATDSPIMYQNWVRYWKSQFTKRHKVPEHQWQTDNWDTRMRSAGMYEDKWLYVLDNPTRKGLVERWEDWPYKGEINEVRWY
jgi:putative transposase